jgi:hypothetical protein
VAATLDDYRWLVSDAAVPWLTIAGEDAQRGNVTVGLLTRMRKELPAERAHLVVEQIELRRRAREKFVVSDRLFFTRKGLEQATDEMIAGYKATRYPPDEPAIDLCCGTGGDLMALAGRGGARGVDRDPVMALLAAANLRAVGIDPMRADVQCADALQSSLAGAWHCDPDRRATGRRSTRAELFVPSLDALSQLLEQAPRAAIKLAPATEVPTEWNAAAELEWLGSRGECRQQVAWFGALAKNLGQRSATIVDARGGSRTIVGNADDAVLVAVKIGRFIYEPHAAVLAAKLTAELCREHSLASVAAGIAYLTADRLVIDGALDSFEIREVLPFDRRQLKAYCREHGLSRLEIKKRGVDLEPARLRKEIAASGEREATIIVAPIDGQVRAIVASRVRQS